VLLIKSFFVSLNKLNGMNFLMKRYLRILIASFFLVSFNVLGQNYKSEIDALRQQMKAMYESQDFNLISKKIPLTPQDVKLEQLADTSKPNKDEKAELAKFQKFRTRIDERGNQISLIYMKPESYANAIVQLRREYQNKAEAALIDLYSEKITFGQFNKIRRDANEELAAKQIKIGSEAARQAKAKQSQEMTNKTAPFQQSQERGKSKEMVDREEICKKVYWGALNSSKRTDFFSAAGEAQLAEANCLMGIASKQAESKNTTCTQIGNIINCTTD
jgi:hypothetical protein